MTDHQPEEDPQVTAATAEPLTETDQHAADLARLEAEVQRRRDASAAASRPERQPVAFGDAIAKAVEKMRAQPGGDERRAALDAKFGAPWEDVAERKRTVRIGAWRSDVTAARHEDLLSWRLEDLAADQHPSVLRRFIDHVHAGGREKQHLVLAGGVGPGKTSAAIAGGTYAAELGMTVRFVNHEEYLHQLRPSGSDEPDWQVRRRYQECDLLVLDDFGVGLGDFASAFTERETYLVVNERLAAGKATIFTTNLRFDDLAKPTMLGQRTMSRVGAKCVPVVFDGPDRRRPATW